MIKNIKIPKVSVIIPTFNRAWIIDQAINSVLEQSYPNIELLIVNDGSNDKTSLLLKRYNSKIQIIHQKKLGVSIARNIGIKKTDGEFLAFLDSDDKWNKNKIKFQINFFKKIDKALICQTLEKWIDNGTERNQNRRSKKLSGNFFDKSLSTCLVTPSAVMLKRKLLNEIGLFDSKFIACEDYDLWLRVSCKYPIFLIKHQLLLKFGGHFDQLSKKKKLDKFRLKSIIYLMKKGTLKLREYLETLKIFKKKCIILASGSFKRKNFQETIKYIKLSKIYTYHIK